MSAQESQPSQAAQARGVELLVQWNNLLHEAARGCNADTKIRAFEALEAWERERTLEEWEWMWVAQFGAGKVGLKAFVEQHGEFMPIGQRR